MARITIEDCLENVENMYELVHLCTKRTRMLIRDAEPLVECKNKDIVVSLREIAAGGVKAVYPETASTVADDGDDLPPLSN